MIPILMILSMSASGTAGADAPKRSEYLASVEYRLKQRGQACTGCLEQKLFKQQVDKQFEEFGYALGGDAENYPNVPGTW